MGLGNGNSKSGNKGSNFNYELRQLEILGLINNGISGLVPMGGLATEATLLDVLAAVDSMRDYEVRLVVDEDTPAVTWLEVRYWDVQTGALAAPVYYLPGSTTPGAPVGNISYINPNSLLSQLLGELVALNAVDFATETTLAAAAVDIAAIETELLDQGITLDGIATDVAAIETELLDQGTTLDAIQVDVAAIETELLDQGTTLDSIDTRLTGSQRTITLVEGAAAGSTTAGVQSVSLTFLGTGGTLDGVTVPEGYTADYSPNKGEDTVGAIAYTRPTGGTESRVLIAYVN